MSPTRRTFIKSVSAAGGAAGLAALPSLAFGETPPVEPRSAARKILRAAAPLDILILGGTGFTGPEQVEYATARGHRVTLFNRNKTRPDFFKGRVEQLIGDLNGDVAALKGHSFDVVIDNPTTLPAWVRNAAKELAGHTKQYMFISTMSVYPDNSHPGRDESDGLTPLPAGLDAYAVSPEDARKHYGALKTESEKEVERQYPGINTIIRPGLIVGPLDKSDRFTYWPVRIDKGGEVMAPGNPTDPVQIIDSRDLAEWMIRMAEARRPFDAALDRRNAGRHQGGYDGRCGVHVGAGGFPQSEWGQRLASHAGLDAAGGRDRRIHAAQQCEGTRAGIDVPSARGDGKGHARLVQDSASGRTEGDG
jgi:2'-hydroxyisoflavone reductase